MKKPNIADEGLKFLAAMAEASQDTSPKKRYTIELSETGYQVLHSFAQVYQMSVGELISGLATGIYNTMDEDLRKFVMQDLPKN